MTLSTLRLRLLPILLACLAPAVLATSGGDDEVEVDGTITALGDSAVAVDGVWFAVTDAIEIRDGEGDASFEDLVVGQRVESRGRYDADDRLVATRIEIEDEDDSGDDDRNEVRFEGLITAVDDDAIQVGSLWVWLTESTEIRGPGSPTVDGLVVGARVEVRGRLADDGSIVADRIEIEDRDDDGDDDREDVEVRGTIDALTDSSLTVAGRTFALTGDTVVLDDDDRPLDLGDLALGLLVEVKGVVAADGRLVATRVELEDFDDDEVELTGTVEALDADGLVVAGLVFAVSDRTVVLDDDRQPIAYSDLAVGMTVEIRADVSPDGVRHATKIQIEDAVEDEVEVKAAIDAVGDGLVVLLGRAFVVDAATVVRDRDGAAIDLSALQAGDVAEVHARRTLAGDLLASRVELDDDPAWAVRLTAAVTAVGADTLWVLDAPFAVDAATVLVGRDGTPATLDAILPGARVRVDATVTDGGLLADRVEVRRAASAVGRVAAPSASGFRLGGLAVALDAETRVETADGRALGADRLSVGQTVRVVGVPDAAGQLAASRVVVLGAAAAPVAEEARPDAEAVRVAAFPNPLAGAGTVRVEAPAGARASVTVYDAIGREVVRLGETTGPESIPFDARSLPSGLYVVRVAADGRPPVTTTVTVVR